MNAYFQSLFVFLDIPNFEEWNKVFEPPPIIINCLIIIIIINAYYNHNCKINA